MADWPLQQISRMDGMRNVNPFLGTTITGGAANVKGAWARVANAPFDCCGIVVQFAQNSSTSDYLVDLGLGASGSETVVIADMLTGTGSSSARGKSLFFPLMVKSGQSVSMRCQNATLSSTLVVDVFFMGESFKGSPSFERFATYGASSSGATAGVSLANPAALNTWGAYTQIVDATKWDHGWVMPVIADLGITTRTAAQRFASQLAVGSAGNEVPCSPPLWLTTPSSALTVQFQPGWYYAVARGQRLAMRQGSSATTTLGMSGVVYAGILGG